MAETEPVIKPSVWGPWATAGFGAAIAVAFLVAQIFVVAGFVVSKITPGLAFDPSRIIEDLNANLGLITSLATAVSAIISLGLIIAFVKIRRGATITEYLGLKRISVKTILVGLAITLGLIVLANVLSIILKIAPDNEFTVDIYRTSVWPPLLWLALIVFAPAFEEGFFRGFLFAGFRQSRIGITGTIVITSLLWTVLHIQYGAFELAVIFVMGILLGVMRFRTGSLLTPILMHAFFNLIALLELALSMG